MEGDWKVSLEFIKAHPADAARILERVRIEETVHFLKEVSCSISARVIERMDSAHATRCLELIGPKQAGAILAELSLEVGALFLRQLEEPLKESLLQSLPHEVEEPLRRVLSYPEGTVGSLMNPIVFSMAGDVSGREALRRFRKQPQRKRDYCYVVDRDHLFIGAVSIREIILSDSHSPISELVRNDIGPLSANQGQQAILEHSGWKEFQELPVVDGKGLLVGVVDYQTFRRLEQKAKKEGGQGTLGAASSALGELYRIGLSGFIRGATSAMGSEEE